MKYLLRRLKNGDRFHLIAYFSNHKTHIAINGFFMWVRLSFKPRKLSLTPPVNSMNNTSKKAKNISMSIIFSKGSNLPKRSVILGKSYNPLQDRTRMFTLLYCETGIPAFQCHTRRCFLAPGRPGSILPVSLLIYNDRYKSVPVSYIPYFMYSITTYRQ